MECKINFIMYNTKTTIRIQIKIAKENRGIYNSKANTIIRFRNANLNRDQFLATLANSAKLFCNSNSIRNQFFAILTRKIAICLKRV